MREVAHRSSRDLRQLGFRWDRQKYQIVSPSPAVALEVWLRAHWIPVPDPPEVEYIKEPLYRVVESDYAGDCDDAATFAAALLLTAPDLVPMDFLAVRMPGDLNFSHVWLRADGVDIDPIVPEEQMPVAGWAERIRLPV